ncbi:MAG: glycosyltransferase [Bacteroidota bacterium]
MKLLVLTSRFPYPIEKGDKLRAYHQLRELSRYFSLVLVSLSEREIQPEERAKLQEFCDSVHIFHLDPRSRALRSGWAMLKGVPAQVGYFYQRSIHRKIQALIEREQPHRIYCQLIRMAPYVQHHHVPTTLDYMDAFSVGMLRRAKRSSGPKAWFFYLESWLVKQYEGRVFNWFDRHSIISKADQSGLRVPDGKRVKVIHNGIDLEYFQAPTPAPLPTHDLVFVGNLGYFPNVDAATYLIKELMPSIWKKRPLTTLLLAGARPDHRLSKLVQDPRITLRGWVDDIREAYLDGQIFIAPLFSGSGQQNKLLEAMALERPAITTPLVNRAIGAEPGKHLLLADQTQGFIDQVMTTLDQPGLQQALGKGARAFVQKHYSWEHSVAELAQLIRAKEPAASR